MVETIEMYDIKVGIHSSKLKEYRRYTCTKGKAHSLTFVKDRSYFINFKQLLPRSHWTD